MSVEPHFGQNFNGNGFLGLHALLVGNAFHLLFFWVRFFEKTFFRKLMLLDAFRVCNQNIFLFETVLLCAFKVNAGRV